jgi:hypothetical protein
MGKRPPGRPPKGLGMVRRRPERSPRSSVKRSPGSSMVGPWKVAHQEWREANVGTTRALLEGTRADLRGWEWRYVLSFSFLRAEDKESDINRTFPVVC